MLEALLDDLQALAHLAHLDHAAVVGVTVDRQRHLELEVLVAGVGACLANVEVATGGAQAGAGSTPLQRLLGVVGGNALGTADEDAVLQRGLFILGEALGHPVEEFAHQLVPAARQVVGDAADAVPGRVHAETGDGFDHLVGALAVGEGEEHRCHGADVLDVGAQVQQMILDAEELGHHHADEVDAVRHGDAGQFLHGQHIGQVVHHPAEVVDAVGVGDVAVPALALGHLLGAAMVVADLRHAIEDFLAIELQDDTEGTVGRRVVRAEVEEHVVLVLAVALHAPVLGLEAQGFLFQVLLGGVQAVGIELGGARRVVLAQRMAFPGRWHQHASEERVAIEGDAEHVPDLALVPVGVGPDGDGGGQLHVAFAERDLDHHVAVSLQRHQVIEDAEVGGGQALALGAQALVGGAQVVEHHIGLADLAQEAQHLDELFAGHPEHRHAGQTGLQREGLGAEARVQFDDDILVVSLVGRDVQSIACSHDLGRFRSTFGCAKAFRSGKPEFTRRRGCAGW